MEQRLLTVGAASALLNCIVCSLLVIGCRKPAGAQQTDQVAGRRDITLTEQNYRAWRKHILPKESELDWQKISWLTTFQDGILAADDAGKPLLFWTINGHPLGCT